MKIFEEFNEKYRECLWNNSAALNYLYVERGLNNDVIDKYGIGLGCPAPFIKIGNKYSAEAIHLGLVNHKGIHFFDSYFTFPVSHDGEIVNIYGRAYNGKVPTHKTLPNIPKTVLYNQQALNKDSIILTESPIDTLTLVEHGFNAASCFGAKLPNETINLFSGKFVFIMFDKDPAGINGAIIAASKLKRVAKRVSIVEFPGRGEKKSDVNLYFSKTKRAVHNIKFLLKNSVPFSEAAFTYIDENQNKKINIDESAIDIKVLGELLFEDIEKKGDSLWVRCPHHSHGLEINRSLQIGGKKNIFFCYGCNVGGGPVKLVKWHLGLKTDDAVNWLKEKFIGQT